MKRAKLPRGKDNKIFAKTAAKTDSLNKKVVKRGGIRL